MFKRVKRALGRVIPLTADEQSAGLTGRQKQVNTDGGADRVATAGRGTVATESPSSLYKCPECQRVYVAAEKQTCGTCQTSVTEIDKSL